MAERWRLVPSLPDYEASDLGRIRRATPGKGTRAGKILATPLDSGGYLTIGTTSGPHRVHVLVAEAFPRADPARRRSAPRRHGEENVAVACACGCGRTFLKFDRGGRPRRFVSGHNVGRNALGQFALSGRR